LVACVRVAQLFFKKIVAQLCVTRCFLKVTLAFSQMVVDEEINQWKIEVDPGHLGLSFQLITSTHIFIIIVGDIILLIMLLVTYFRHCPYSPA
jgi:hypothetical protein